MVDDDTEHEAGNSQKREPALGDAGPRALGQGVWLDYLRRGMTRSGELDGLIRDGLRGMTSNPTIFEHAIAGSADYDQALKDPALSRKTDRELFEVLAIQDVQEAADRFRPVYDRTDGADGFVSLEARRQ